MPLSKKPRVRVTKDSRGHIHIRLNAGLKTTLGRGGVKDVGIPGRATGSSKQEFITRKKMAWHSKRMAELQVEGASKEIASKQAMEEVKSQNFESEWQAKSKAKDADPWKRYGNVAEAKAAANQLRAEGKTVKILKHEFTNPRTGRTDTNFEVKVADAKAKDARTGKTASGKVVELGKVVNGEAWTLNREGVAVKVSVPPKEKDAKDCDCNMRKDAAGSYRWSQSQILAAIKSGQYTLLSGLVQPGNVIKVRNLKGKEFELFVTY
jgi:hypothetical protein